MEGVKERVKILVILVLLFSLDHHKAAAQVDVEKKKIEFLLTQIENLKAAKFWRNGSSYLPQQAAEHLRMKWSKAGNTIKTAKDFIDKIASKSSMSGKAYEIEFDNGTKVETRSFLLKKLEEWKT